MNRAAALYPSLVRAHGNSHWDRDGDLERIKATYAAYEAEGRDRLWSRGSPGYARLAAELDARLNAALASSLEPGRRDVLDLGCGTGELAELAPSLDASWTGVDLRRVAVARATAAYPGAAFLVASADALPFEDSSFDAVVARLLFSSLPSPELERAVAREVARVLRPGGWLVWLDIRYPNPTNREVHAIPESRIRHLFEGWAIDVASAGLIPPLARRFGALTPIAYPLLSALPFLRSHVVGRLSRPRDVEG